MQENQELVPQARYALERMVMFVQESDYIFAPDTTSPTKVLTVSERLSDQYNNQTHEYTDPAIGDGFPDADNDGDRLINEGTDVNGNDPTEFITFRLDETDADKPCLNKCLKEKMPDYGTSPTAERIICENVTGFSCKRLSPGIVEIVLTLQKGTKAVTLRTTAKARWVN